MKSVRKQYLRVLCLLGRLAISVVFLGSCAPGSSSTRTELNTTGTFEPICGLGAYELLCWTVNLKDTHFTKREMSFDNPLQHLPVPGEKLGEVNNIVAEGTLVANARLLVSPGMLSVPPVPPPLCAALNPEVMGDPSEIVVDFRITGNYKYAFGDQWRDQDFGLPGRGIHSRIVIVENNLRFEQFDIRGLPSRGDDLVKKFLKNTIMREADQAVVQLVNNAFCGCDAPNSLPAYSPEINNDHSDGGFCKLVS